MQLATYSLEVRVRSCRIYHIINMWPNYMQCGLHAAIFLIALGTQSRAALDEAFFETYHCAVKLFLMLTVRGGAAGRGTVRTTDTSTMRVKQEQKKNQYSEWDSQSSDEGEDSEEEEDMPVDEASEILPINVWTDECRIQGVLRTLQQAMKRGSDKNVARLAAGLDWQERCPVQFLEFDNLESDLTHDEKNEIFSSPLPDVHRFIKAGGVPLTLPRTQFENSPAKKKLRLEIGRAHV